MGTLGRKIDRYEALNEFDRIKSILIPIHAELGIDNIVLSGSLRREKSVNIGDIDILLITVNGDIPYKLKDIFIEQGYEIDASGKKLLRMISQDNIQVDFYSCSDIDYPCMQAYLTGPSEYNIQMRAVAKRKGYKLSQYALYNSSLESNIKISSEEELFNCLGCKFINPVDRLNFYDSLKYNPYKK